jgi:SEC-C motif-containing protein
MTDCPCGSGRLLSACCEPYLSGTSPAPTAEALMRARYSAFATGRIDYLEETLLPETRHDFDRAHVTDWAGSSQWIGLEVLAVSDGGEGDDEGMVEFVAHFTVGGRDHHHHEKSRFVKRDGRWWYLDGVIVPPRPRTVTRIGRNDPCPCGSGRKYKKCCGGTAT